MSASQCFHPIPSEGNLHSFVICAVSRSRKRTDGESPGTSRAARSEEHTSELQPPCNVVCRLLLEKKQIRGHKGPVRPSCQRPPLINPPLFGRPSKSQTRWPNSPRHASGIIVPCDSHDS